MTALRIEKTGVLNQSVDATDVSGTASLLQVELLAADQATLLSIDVAPMQAQATAPDGGVDCDDGGEDVVDVSKDADPDPVQPGDSFDYTIDITNNDPECTLTGITVQDVVTGPEGSEVTAPDSAQVSGSFPDGAEVTIENVPDVPAGESTSVVITVAVPEDAETPYSDDVTVTGSCDGEDVTGQDSLDGPGLDTAADTGDTGAEQDGDGDDGVLAVSDDQMPRTGGGALAVLGLGGLLGAAALTRRS